MAAGIGHGVVDLIGIFGNNVAAVVAGVLEIGVAANEGGAAEVDVTVGVDDAEVRRDRSAGEDRIVGEGVAVVAGAKFIENVFGYSVFSEVSPRT